MKRVLMALGFCLSIGSLRVAALPILVHPSADELAGPEFLQTFAGLQIVSQTGGIGRTEPFSEALPANSIPGNFLVNILGNFSAFDSSGNPAAFGIAGVEVTQGSSTFTPAFGQFNFAGHPTFTAVDSLNFSTVTFNASDLTLAFTFQSNSSLAFSYELLTTGLDVNSFVTYQEVDTGQVPEPTSFWLVALTVAGLAVSRLPTKRTRN